MKVLLVEDDDAIAVPLTDALTRVGYDVARVSTGQAALGAADRDLVLLDLGLPDADGIDVARQLRSRSSVPIIVITARDDEMDRVIGLEVGADDYLVKPFGVRELIARIRALMRRVGPLDDDDDGGSVVTAIDGLRVDRRSHRVHVDAVEVALTPKEFDLLALLAEDPGAVYRRETILEEVWDPNWYGPTKTLDVHVASLRRKLGDPSWVETVRGVGYRLGHVP